MTYQEFIDYNRTKDQGPYTQKHHIIPLSAGGPDTPDNIIRLSWLAHYYAHYLLAKENPDDKKIQANLKIKGDIDRWLHWCYDCWNRLGENNPMHGKIPWSKGATFTEEHRNHLSESHKGYIMPEEQKQKISSSMKGKIRSEETRQKIREARIRYWAERKMNEQ